MQYEVSNKSTVSSIRQEFLNYFKNNDHEIIESSSLVPENDPTLLFTNAGMVQFKDVFTGKKILPFKRATTSQKCLRAGGKHNDLENVGYTSRHHTFFEMLGNFSFGDYFKKEVIPFAWEFVTKYLCLEPSRLYVTVHSSDEEAAEYWKSITGFSDDKIIRISTNDNFWAMGDTGPCGPCSEIFYDHGSSIAGGLPGTKDADGDRFVEIWNLVFMQFETLENGQRLNLPKPSIDTGMGLERIAAVLQGVHSNFEIDLFKNIISDIVNITNKPYQNNESSNNVIADHMRAISFMISDGIIPSNEGRGYVLRRIIRRALRHGYSLGMREPFLYKLVQSVSNVMGNHYKELTNNQSNIVSILKGEEEGFMRTIDNGMHILYKAIYKMGSSKVFPADVAYKLYDTFGFPFDLTQDILRSENKTVSIEEFDTLVSKNKENAKRNWIGTGDTFTDKILYEIAKNNDKIEFVRHTNEINDATILYIINDNKQQVSTAKAGDTVYIILNKTPFYATAGGQLGDSGTLELENNKAEVIDTIKIAGVIVHKCNIIEGKLNVSNKVVAKLDKYRRLATARNHTATHMLHKALKMVLGDHVFQQGSLVAPDKLRFDFFYDQLLTKEEIKQVEDIVLTNIDNSYEVKAEIMSKEEAIKRGAIALFNEKYPGQVRMVTIGENFSKELCFGEHVDNTAQIGAFKIISNSSIGSNTQRIEAITGRCVRQYLEERINENLDIINNQSQTINKLNKEVEVIKSNLFIANINLSSENINDIKLKYTIVKDANPKNILSLIDNYKSSQDKLLLIIGNELTKSSKCTLYVFISNILQNSVDINNIIDELNNKLKLNIKQTKRKDLLQFGGINKEEFNKCLEIIKDNIT
ncbi:MAG: alanine--tRNA ligase [Alphaproteobacteria bacterium]|nr:alanine--tRNA ligase [Alphaproteobacteria bacterium]